MNADDGRGRGRRWVVKVGSSLLIGEDDRLRAAWLDTLVDDIAGEIDGGREVVLVSSGAIALGLGLLGRSRRHARLPDLQAAAAIGQIRLADAWHSALKKRGKTAAQILLTAEDTESRRRFLNARDTVSTLLSRGAVPVVNENDTVATDEIRYGDNDRLAARIAQMMDADTLVLLSDVDGLYSAQPGTAGAELVRDVVTVDERIEAMVGRDRSVHGTGGMGSKLAAARLATAAGADVYVTSGRDDHALRRFIDGGNATRFRARGRAGEARKRWIGAAIEPLGGLTIDDGAAQALADGGSLLPVGVVAVDGEFDRGDTVRICAADGREIARGLTAYDSADARRLVGRRSADIEAVLGFAGPTSLVHRNNLVMLDVATLNEVSQRRG